MFLHGSELSTVSVINDGAHILKQAGTHANATHCLVREIKILQYLQERGHDFGFIQHSPNQTSVTLMRHGTHDLSDASVDLTRREMLSILADAALQLDLLHQQGVVHRDLKPSNVMVNRVNKRYAFAGLIDFGLSLFKQRAQSDPGAVGGTRLYAHNCQYNPQARAHAGQDWYSFSMIALTLTRGLALSVEAELKERSSDTLSVFTEVEHRTIVNDLVQSLVNALEALVQHAVSLHENTEPDFSELEEHGKAFVDVAQASSNRLRNHSNWRSDEWMNQPALNHSKKVKSHDVLIIIDETGSLSNHMPSIQKVLKDSMGEFENAMDLRVDLWAVRDYARAGDESHETVRKVGYRLVGKSVFAAVELLRADATQHDDAEAYEQAFEEAYLHANNDQAAWKPRKNATRTVLLIGDSFAHGWLRMPWLPIFLSDIKKGVGDQLELHTKLKNQFTQLHPNALSRNNEDRREREALIQRLTAKEDAFGKQVQEVPKASGGKKYRANLQRAVERLRDQQQCTIHTISLNPHVVSEYYMIFTAMLGGGVFIKGSENIGHKLIGVLAVADPQLLERFRTGWAKTGQKQASDDTLVLNTFSGLK